MKRSKETGRDCNRKSKRNGQPQISTDRDDRFLARRSLQDRFKPATKLKGEWEKIGRVARKKPLLTITHKRRRLDFAKKHNSWSKEDWERVL